MKCMVQYTHHATVRVDNQIIGEIQQGYVVYVGIEATDTPTEAIYMATKIAKLRVIPDENQKLNLNLASVNGQVLLISQFTLCADTHSNRPSFSSAAPKDHAITLLTLLKNELETTHHIPVSTGQFGAHMEVDFINHGPITIYL